MTKRQRKSQLEKTFEHTLANIFEAVSRGEKPEAEHRFSPTVERELEKLRVAVAQAELAATQRHYLLRTQLAAIARDLAPQAASLARKGRPRLLAVLAKISQEQNRKK